MNTYICINSPLLEVYNQNMFMFGRRRAWECLRGHSFSICVKGRTGQQADTRGWEKKNQPETKNVLVGSPPAQVRWTVKPIPAHVSIEILSFQSAFPSILLHLILTTTLWERESSFPVVETEALRERRFAGNWSSEETAICSTLSE